jgi:hypothetical protein
MELKDLSEDQLDLAYFALAQALDGVSVRDCRMPFVVTDGPGGRELTWIERAEQAYELDGRRHRAVVWHDTLSSDESGAPIPAVVVELTGIDLGGTALIAQLYRPGGPHRRFAALGDPYLLHTASA